MEGTARPSQLGRGYLYPAPALLEGPATTPLKTAHPPPQPPTTSLAWVRHRQPGRWAAAGASEQQAACEPSAPTSQDRTAPCTQARLPPHPCHPPLPTAPAASGGQRWACTVTQGRAQTSHHTQPMARHQQVLQAVRPVQ